MKLAILGGTFDPPHNGHISIAQHALQETEYDAVVFVPTNIPAHKTSANRATPRERFEMVELICRSAPGFTVDSCDIERGGKSYSIDTLSDLSKRHSFAKPAGFIIGDDLVKSFHTWRRVDDLILHVSLLVAHRTSREELRFPYPHRYLNNDIFRYTSSEIRSNVASGRKISKMVPGNIERYISEHELYR